jgi:XTP/dITP diphosphohydrolase
VDRLIARLASRNPHKARELEQLLAGWRVEPLEAGEYPPEAGESYYENARGKALFGRTVAEPDVWVLGEDSGLEVTGLGGGPGIQSARSGGADPVGWLLRELRGMEGERRRARYICELVGFSPEGKEVHGTGSLDGRIADLARGSEGFGFDPVFVPDGEEQTVAELGNRWKASHSHRAKASHAFLRASGEAD